MADKLAAHIRKVKTLARLASDAAPKVARALEQSIQESISAGRAPDGTPWKPRKDGGRPLQNAGAALVAVTQEKAVAVVLEGVEARHHYGAVRGKVKRQILPVKLEPRMTQAITAVCEAEFVDKMAR